MKKITYSKASLGIAAAVAFSLLSTQYCPAQITINSSDYPSIGSIETIARDTTPTVTPGSAGAGQTWNLSGLHNQVVDSLYFVDPSLTPFFSNFPTANLCVRGAFGLQGVNYEYGIVNADSGIIQGTITLQGVDTAFGTNTPAVLGVPFPATYMTSWYSSTVNVEEVNLGAYIGRVVVKESYTDTVDGWGSVTTPAGTYNNALRVKQIVTQIYDSTYYNAGAGWIALPPSPPITSETYEWLVNGGQYEVADLNIDTLGGPVTSGNYILNYVTGISQVQANNSSSLVYPNPASSYVSIQVKSSNLNGYVKVMDVTGREIVNTIFTNGKAMVNISNYTNGVYFYLITDANGSIVDKGKFSVIH